MAYDVHITRKKDWFNRDQPGITFEEWSSYIDSDASMRLDGVARMTAPGGDVIEMKSPGLAVWTAYSGHDEDRTAWFSLSRSGNISVRIPIQKFSGRCGRSLKRWAQKSRAMTVRSMTQTVLSSASTERPLPAKSAPLSQRISHHDRHQPRDRDDERNGGDEAQCVSPPSVVARHVPLHAPKRSARPYAMEIGDRTATPVGQRSHTGPNSSYKRCSTAPKRTSDQFGGGAGGGSSTTGLLSASNRV